MSNVLDQMHMNLLITNINLTRHKSAKVGSVIRVLQVEARNYKYSDMWAYKFGDSFKYDIIFVSLLYQ